MNLLMFSFLPLFLLVVANVIYYKKYNKTINKTIFLPLAFICFFWFFGFFIVAEILQGNAVISEKLHFVGYVLSVLVGLGIVAYNYRALKKNNEEVKWWVLLIQIIVIIIAVIVLYFILPEMVRPVISGMLN